MYNSQATIEECLSSAKSIDTYPIQIIVIDDCSSDNSVELVKKMAEHDPRVKILGTERNLGSAEARNRGVSESSGKYVVFLDSDDLLDAKTLKELPEIIGRGDEPDVIIGNYRIQNTFPVPSCELILNFTEEFAVDRNAVIRRINDFGVDGFRAVCWRYLLNRNFLIEQNIKFIPARVFEDVSFVIEIISKATTFMVMKDIFYTHRPRIGSLSSETSLLINATRNLSYAARAVGRHLALLDSITPATDIKEFILSSALKTWETIIPVIATLNDSDLEEIDGIVANQTKHLSVSQIDQSKYSSLKLFFGRSSSRPAAVYKAAIASQIDALLKDEQGNCFLIYCYSLHGIVLCKILREKGFNVLGFLDSNPRLDGVNIEQLDLFIRHPESQSAREWLSNANDKNLAFDNLHGNERSGDCLDRSHYGVDKNFLKLIICNRRESVIKSICSNLLSSGLQAKQLLEFDFKLN